MRSITRTSAEVLVPIALALLSLIFSGWTKYTSNDRDLSNRITAVETQQRSDQSATSDMKGDIREIRQNTNRLVELFLGSKK